MVFPAEQQPVQVVPQEMAEVIADIIGKGGVGKTTTADGLMNGFAIQEQMGWTFVPGSVPPPLDEDAESTELGIDLDPQRNLTMGNGLILDEEEEENAETVYSAHHVILNPNSGIWYTVRRSPTNGVDIIPASLTMNNLDSEIRDPKIIGPDTLLQRALYRAKGTKQDPVTTQAAQFYKRIWGDTPRNLGATTTNLIFASTFILVPFQPEVYASDALDQLDNHIAKIQEVRPETEIGAILITQYNRNASLHRSVESQIRERYGDKVMETVIPTNISLAEAPSTGMSIYRYAPKSTGAIAYMEAVIELQDRLLARKRQRAGA